MVLVLLRHALKADNGTANPPLTPKGFEQAQNLKERVQKGLLPKPTKTISSPRLRAQQTLQPLCQFANTPLEIIDNLNERQSTESAADFYYRIQSFFQNLKVNNSQECIYLCSHVDWLFESLALLGPSIKNMPVMSSWASAQVLVLESEGEKWICRS